MEALSASPLNQRSSLVTLARGAAWMVSLASVLHVISLALASSPLAAALAGAVIADLVGTPAGVRWSDPDEPNQAGYRSRIARRIAVGAITGLTAALLLVGITAAIGSSSGASELARSGANLGRLSPSLALTLVRIVALAVRDETLLTGVVVATIARCGLPPIVAIAFSGLAHGAAICWMPGSSLATVVLATCSGALFALLWQRGRGAWAAVAASTTWGMVAGYGLRDTIWTNTAIGLGIRPDAHAWIGSTIFVILILCIHAVTRRFPEKTAL